MRSLLSAEFCWFIALSHCAHLIFFQAGEEAERKTRNRPTPPSQSDKRTEVCGREFYWLLTCSIGCSRHCLSCTRPGISGIRIVQITSNRASNGGRQMRQKLRSACRVLLVHCVVAIVLSPGCICCTRVRGTQME